MEALVDDLITVNPCAGVKRLKKGQRPELEVWTLEERDRFLDVLYREHFPIFQMCAVALFTGLRPAELRGRLRDAVDVERCQIRVHRQWCSKQNQLVPYTKTREARTVPIPRAILEYLGDKRSLPGDAQLFPFLCNAFGYMYLKPLSHMMLQGASLAEVKELLGHRNLESTAIYLYYIPIAIRSARQTARSNALGAERREPRRDDPRVRYGWRYRLQRRYGVSNFWTPKPCLQFSGLKKLNPSNALRPSLGSKRR